MLTLRRLSRVAAEHDNHEQSLVHAQKAVQISDRNDAAALRDLAVALALNGNYEAAAATAEESLNLLDESPGPAAAELRETIQQNLATYRPVDGP